MKTKPISILLLALGFSTLFYNQNLGLNLSIFSILIAAFSAYNRPEILKNKTWISALIASQLANLSLIYYGNTLSIIAVTLSTLILAGISLNKQTSVFTALLQGGSSLLVAPFKHYSKIELWIINQEKKPAKWRKLFLTIIVGGILTVFLLLYRSSNPIFEAWTNKINLNFISFPWLMFTFWGAWISYALIQPITHQYFGQFDNKARQKIKKTEENDVSILEYKINLSDEIFLAKWTLITLNIMLLVVNIGDLNFVFNGHQLPENVSFASYLHRGVGTLIFTIVLSIALILVFFRGNLNFQENNKVLKSLALIWIFQNMVLLFAVLVKNHLYIESYGLTYKRIGVYTYTFLTALGLISTILKIVQNRENSYIFLFNGWSFFLTLMVATLINWDNMIIQNNKKFDAEIDIFYLLSLSDNSIPELQKITPLIIDSYSQTIFKRRLNNKINQFKAREIESSWQSWCYKRKQTLKEIE